MYELQLNCNVHIVVANSITRKEGSVCSKQIRWIWSTLKNMTVDFENVKSINLNKFPFLALIRYLKYRRNRSTVKKYI